MKRGGIAVRGALMLALGFAAQAACAANDSPYLFGDWGGARTPLADDGLTFDFGYVSEAAHNFSGGITELIQRKRIFHVINAAGIQQPLHVLADAKD